MNKQDFKNPILQKGVLLSSSENGSLITGDDFFAAKDKNPLFSSIKISVIQLFPKARVVFDPLKLFFSILLVVERNGLNYEVPCVDGRFADYLIIDNVWRKISGIDGLNDSLDKGKILNGVHFTLGNYLTLKQTPDFFSGIPFEDEASSAIKKVPVAGGLCLPSTVNATLYQYQRTGFAWLDFMSKENCGGVLADEMGLGKTLQIITLIDSKIERGSSGPFLVVAPVSLIENWRREFAKFAPSVETFIHFGADRTGYYKTLENHQVVITAYTTVVSDISVLKSIEWEMVILDEAQAIKNPDAVRTKSVKELTKKCGFCVTGTPFQNHMIDIWSLVDFALPGYLGTRSKYLSSISDDLVGAADIEPLITPIMLRRTVAEVGQDLPEKIEIPQAIHMDEKEADIYENVRQDTIKAYSSSKAATLPLISKLRLCCADPVLADPSLGSDLERYSAKYQRLIELLAEISSQNEKALVFTSFVGMIELMKKDISDRLDIPVYCIYGATEISSRQAILDEFSSIQGPALLIINPNAAGTGLNITCANHVIHYTPEWNPAVEDQATARAYRRGQKKNVFVYHLFYANTVEDFMANKISSKREMSEQAIVGSKGQEQTMQDILSAISLSPKEEANNATKGNQ